jgi:hypothetical protein
MVLIKNLVYVVQKLAPKLNSGWLLANGQESLEGLVSFRTTTVLDQAQRLKRIV